MADSDPTQVMAFAHAELARLKEENGVVVLTDMYGATPANIAGQLAKIDNVRVLAGVNLPMLVRALLPHRAARQAGRQGAVRRREGRSRGVVRYAAAADGNRLRPVRADSARTAAAHRIALSSRFPF